jgi:hypothetical protein
MIMPQSSLNTFGQATDGFFAILTEQVIVCSEKLGDAFRAENGERRVP